MYITHQRNKDRAWLLSISWRLKRLSERVLPKQVLLRLLLDLEWIFGRLAFEQSCRFYSHSSHPGRLESYDLIRPEISPETTVLDLGSHAGDMSHWLSLQAKEVIGVELQPEHVAMARQNHKRDNLSFVNQDAIEYLKHTDKIFDVLIMSHILEHLDNPSEFLKSVSGSFKRIYIEVPDFEATPLNLVRVDVGSKLIYTDEDHVTEFDRVELERIIAMSGLTIFKSNYSSGLLRVWCRHG